MPLTRRALPLVPCLIVAFVTQLGCSKGGAAARPNILFISIDTLRADHLGTYGYEKATSPNIDAFAKTAVVFDEAFSHSSWTLPSFATMFTSMYGQTHKCAHFDDKLDESFTTLPELLQKAGYRTRAVVSHVFTGKRHGLIQGFDELDDSLQHEITESHQQISSPGVTQSGIDWLEKQASSDTKSKPFFLWLHYFDPHELYQVHPETASQFRGPGEIELYDGEIAFTDLWIGKLFDALTRFGLDSNTIVILVADHGEEFTDHGGERHGRSLYREVLHVPFMIKAPGMQPHRVADTVRTVDLMPTVLSLAGLPVPSNAQGESLLPALRGERFESLPVYGEVRLREDYSAESYSANGWTLILDHSGATHRGNAPPVMVNGERMQAIRPRETLLFRTSTDPKEQNDVASLHPDIVEKLLAALQEMRRKARDLATSGEFKYSPAIQLEGRDRHELEQLGYTGK